jgi:hypothetical protein
MSGVGPQTRFVFTKAISNAADLKALQQFVQDHCVEGAYCQNPEQPGIISRVRLSTRHREGWLVKQKGARYAVVATGAEFHRLHDVMHAQPIEWSWSKDDDSAAPVEEEEPVEVAEATVVINNTNNSNNSVFNLTLYLQDTCQNAPNLTDFVQGITASLANIDYENDRSTWDYAEKLAHMPYAEGVAKLLTDKLGEMQQIDRPIQCTDGKRGSFQIKHMGEWQSGNIDDAVGTPFRDALHTLGQTRVGYAIRWKQQHSGEEYGANHASIMKNVVAGVTKQQTTSARRRIASELAKQTVIVK